jgi:hypothetical protein
MTVMDVSVTVFDIWYIYDTTYVEMLQISAPITIKHHMPNTVWIMDVKFCNSIGCLLISTFVISSIVNTLDIWYYR